MVGWFFFYLSKRQPLKNGKVFKKTYNLFKPICIIVVCIYVLHLNSSNSYVGFTAVTNRISKGILHPVSNPPVGMIFFPFF